MNDAPLALAFAAGLVATFNPCGFAMLPAYIGWFVGLDDDGEAEDSVDATLSRALLVGAVVSAGFLTVFGIAGLLLHAGLRVLIDVIPWVALSIGLAMVGLGIATLRGHQVKLSLTREAPGQRSRRSMFSFGISYALASLSCTLPVFLTVVVGSLATTSLLGGIATLAVYGLAMSLTLLGLTLAVALTHRGTVRRLRRLSRYVNTAAGILLVVAGAYITWFWAQNLRSGAGATGGTGRFVETLSQRVVEVAGDNWVIVGAVLGAAVLGVMLRLLLASDDEPTNEPSATATADIQRRGR